MKNLRKLEQSIMAYISVAAVVGASLVVIPPVSVVVWRLPECTLRCKVVTWTVTVALVVWRPAITHVIVPLKPIIITVGIRHCAQSKANLDTESAHQSCGGCNKHLNENCFDHDALIETYATRCGSGPLVSTSDEKAKSNIR
jgi:hypothetical protein